MMPLTHSYIQKKAWGHIQALPYYSLNHIEWYQIAGTLNKETIERENFRELHMETCHYANEWICLIDA